MVVTTPFRDKSGEGFMFHAMLVRRNGRWLIDRYDVATRTLEEGRTPNLAALLPYGGWEKRHSPGSFTLPASACGFFLALIQTGGRASALKGFHISAIMPFWSAFL